MPLKISAVTGKDNNKLSIGTLTVLIGPNNCGKSQTLRDIRDYVTKGSTDRLVVLGDIEADIPTSEEAMPQLVARPHSTPNHTTYYGVGYDLLSRGDFSPENTWLNNMWRSAATPDGKRQMLQYLGKFWLSHLDAPSRFRLSEPSPSFDTRTESPSNALQAFFAAGKEVHAELRNAFKNAFQKDIVVDWAAMSRLYLRIGDDFGTVPESRRELDTLVSGAESLETQGDGYRSFAGVVLAKLAFPNRLFLLDEPEAFLHPAQARSLGKWLGEHSKKSGTQVILATHSSDLLWGIVSTNSEASVIRLNRKSNSTSFHLVPNATTRNLVESPLLSSQPVLDALFQRGVVVCEGDPDRAVYQAIATRHSGEEGGSEIAFMHSNGKEAAKSPLQLFRETGTPVATIVDIDVFNSEQVLTGIYRAITTEAPPELIQTARVEIAKAVEKRPEVELIAELKAAVHDWQNLEVNDLRVLKKKLKSILKQASHWDDVKENGVGSFEPNSDERTTLESLINDLEKTGIFVVPVGVLEKWLPDPVSKGSQWNRAMLERISTGNCPQNAREFVAKVVAFISGVHMATAAVGEPMAPTS